MLDRQTLFGRVNPAGPENWPEENALSTVTPPAAAGQASSPDAGQNAGQASATSKGALPDTPSAAPSVAVPPAGHADKKGQPSAPTPEAPSPSLGAPAPQTSPDGASASASRPPAETHSNVSGKVSGQVMGLPGQPPKEEKKEAAPVEPRPVTYVDEHGNPVPKPADPVSMLEEAERLIKERKYIEALPQLEKLKELPSITPEQREKALYHISDCVWFKYADNPLAGFEPIVSATSEAMNANLRSPLVPEALLRLGLANVNVGNLTDAGGYMVALFRRYPDYPGVAQGFTALGKAQLARAFDAQAEQSFSLVLDKYPESASLQDASVGLAYALNNQKKYDNAQLILGFISKRWPRYYIEQPSFLFLQAGNEEALGKAEVALTLYWLYYNLVPGQKDNDALLLKMADTYTRQGNKLAADFIYHHIESRFPETPSAAVAGLRLAEQGVYDSPVTYEEMSRVFARTMSANLAKVYKDLAASSNTAPAAILARLKEAMWLYWNKGYTEAIGRAADFIDAYPENPNVPQARDIIWMAFQKELANSLAEKNYGRILILWNGFPLVRERYGALDPRMRFALAQGQLESGEDARALDMLAEFLKSPMDPQYGEAVFTEFFNRYLKSGAWDKILDLGRLVSTWPLNAQLRSQLDYALALSAQNLNLAGPALAMWRQLAEKADIPLYQRAYATYFLARDAEQRKDIRRAYELNRKVIDLFTRLQDERSDKSDPQRIKDAMVALMDICEVGNRIPEALEWLGRYNAFAPQNSPEYPGLRFREARLYRKLGDASRAQALLEDIARNYPDSPFARAAAAELRTFEVSRDLQSFMPGGGASQAPAGQPPAVPPQPQPGQAQ